jgi:hypothetical protein
MTSCITWAASLVVDVLFVYKIHCPSDNCYLAEMPSHIHLEPTAAPTALTLSYRSLRSSRRSIRNGCREKVRKVVSMYFGKVL